MLVDEGRTRTKVKMVILAQREPFYYIINLFLLIFVLTSVCAYVFVIDPSKAEARASVTITLLLTSVAFKSLADDKLPHLNYLTMLDCYLFWCFACQLSIILENGVVSIWAHDNEPNGFAHTVDRNFFAVLSMQWLVGHVVLFVLFQRYLYKKKQCRIDNFLPPTKLDTAKKKAALSCCSRPLNEMISQRTQAGIAFASVLVAIAGLDFLASSYFRT